MFADEGEARRDGQAHCSRTGQWAEMESEPQKKGSATFRVHSRAPSAFAASHLASKASRISTWRVPTGCGPRESEIFAEGGAIDAMFVIWVEDSDVVLATTRTKR